MGCANAKAASASHSFGNKTKAFGSQKPDSTKRLPGTLQTQLTDDSDATSVATLSPTASDTVDVFQVEPLIKQQQNARKDSAKRGITRKSKDGSSGSHASIKGESDAASQATGESDIGEESTTGRGPMSRSMSRIQVALAKRRSKEPRKESMALTIAPLAGIS